MAAAESTAPFSIGAPAVSRNVRHSNNYNLLRFLFASLVIFSHCPDILDGDRRREPLTNLFGTISLGELAVDSFFLLSGYLIVKSWNTHPKVIAFLKSRILRIYPAFVVVCLLCAFGFGPIAGAPDFFQNLDLARFARGVIALRPPQIPPVFVESHFPLMNNSLWTVSYEFKCYLFVLVFGLIGGFNRRVTWLLLSIAFTTIFILVKTGLWWPQETSYIRFATFFGIGGTFFLYGQEVLQRKSWTLVLLAGLLLTICLFSKIAAEPAVALFWGYLILKFAESKIPYLQWFNHLPDVSYGVYLYAWPITKMIIQINPSISLAALTLQTFMLSVIAGTISWYLVERPFLRLK